MFKFFSCTETGVKGDCHGHAPNNSSPCVEPKYSRRISNDSSTVKPRVVEKPSSTPTEDENFHLSPLRISKRFRRLEKADESANSSNTSNHARSNQTQLAQSPSLSHSDTLILPPAALTRTTLNHSDRATRRGGSLNDVKLSMQPFSHKNK